MKKLLIPGLLCLFALVACGPDEQSAQPAADNTADDQADVTTAPAPTEPATADTDAGEKPEVVEESAADAAEEAAGDAPLLLAQADTATAGGNWKFREGKDYIRIVPTQPTVGGADKVEVAEVFWYGCTHCNAFEPTIHKWAENKPANARFVRIPAMWNSLVKRHAQLYYTEEVLAKSGTLEDPDAFHAAVFEEYHQRNNRLTSEASIQGLFQRFGVSAADFDKTWNSFEVMQKMRVAEDLANRYGITGVPTVVVNGKYRTGAAEAGGYPRLIEVINELVARESAR